MHLVMELPQTKCSASDVRAQREPNANVSTKITILVLQPCPLLSAPKYNILQMKQHNPTPQSSCGG